MGFYVPWLADAARLTGYPVVETPGWRSRGHGPMRAVEGVVMHHTANPQPGNYPSLRIVRDGRAGLAGPLAQLGLGRDGTVYIIAAGLSYHGGASSWAGFHDLNDEFLGIEAESAGTRDDWTTAQRDAYPRLVAALLHYMRRGADRVGLHREVCRPAGRKIDAAYWDGSQTRARITWLLADPLTRIPRFNHAEADTTREDDMALANFPISGKGILTLICTVGKASGITSAAWISATVGEGSGSVRCFAQSDAGGVHDWTWNLKSSNGFCKREYEALRDGVTQVIIHHDLTGRGVIALETKPK
ncbi:MAG: peptidoglycan recognition protein family protein [Pseudonocardiaceae bacterium]